MLSVSLETDPCHHRIASENDAVYQSDGNPVLTQNKYLAAHDTHARMLCTHCAKQGVSYAEKSLSMEGTQKERQVAH